jgi:hypothetical protein
MGWGFWRKAEDEGQPHEAPPADSNSPPPELTIDELMAGPPEDSLSRDAKPSYLDETEERQPQDGAPLSSSYTSVNVGELRKQRVKREVANGVWARMKRGDLSATNMPGVSAAGGAAGRFMEVVISPFRMLFGNLGTVFATGLLMVALAFLSYFLIEWMRGAFGGLY